MIGKVLGVTGAGLGIAAVIWIASKKAAAGEEGEGNIEMEVYIPTKQEIENAAALTSGYLRG